MRTRRALENHLDTPVEPGVLPPDGTIHVSPDEAAMVEYRAERLNDLRPELSIEQELMEASSMNDAEKDTAQIISESNRLLDIGNATEDLAVAVDRQEQPSPTELQILAVAGQMATAGTDVPGEALVPATESFYTKGMAVESLMERARALGKTIWEYLAKMFGRIKDFFKSLFNRSKTVEKRIHEQVAKLKAVKNVKPVTMADLGEPVQKAMTYVDSPIADTTLLLRCIDSTQHAVKWIRTGYMQEITSKVEKAKSNLAGATLQTFDSVLKKTVVDWLNEQSTMPRTGRVAPAETKDTKQVSGPGTFGNGYLMWQSPAVLGSKVSADGASKLGLRFVSSPVKNTAEAFTPELSTYQQCVAKLEALSAEMGQLSEAKYGETLEKLAGELQKTVEEVAGRIGDKDDRKQGEIINKAKGLALSLGASAQPLLSFINTVDGGLMASLEVLSRAAA